MRQRVLGVEHQAVFYSCFDLALCLEAQKKYEEALGMARRVEAGWKRVMGEDHQKTKDAVNLREKIEAEMLGR